MFLATHCASPSRGECTVQLSWLRSGDDRRRRSAVSGRNQEEGSSEGSSEKTWGWVWCCLNTRHRWARRCLWPDSSCVMWEQLCPFITAPSFVQQQQQEEEEKEEEEQSGGCSLFSALASLGFFNSAHPPIGWLDMSISICFKLWPNLCASSFQPWPLVGMIQWPDRQQQKWPDSNVQAM